MEQNLEVATLEHICLKNVLKLIEKTGKARILIMSQRSIILFFLCFIILILKNEKYSQWGTLSEQTNNQKDKYMWQT